jgi:hypothetical protein
MKISKKEYGPYNAYRPTTRAGHLLKARALRLPYGIWTCGDGSEVLFNRDYEPLWRRLPDGTARPEEPDEGIEWVRMDPFYDDGTPTRQRLKAGRDALRKWGLPIPHGL